jgi:hypothetical protein
LTYLYRLTGHKTTMYEGRILPLFIETPRYQEPDRRAENGLCTPTPIRVGYHHDSIFECPVKEITTKGTLHSLRPRPSDKQKIDLVV